jgi:hypothetical protein
MHQWRCDVVTDGQSRRGHHRMLLNIRSSPQGSPLAGTLRWKSHPAETESRVLGPQTALLPESGRISPVRTRAYPTCLTRSLSCADTRLSNAESLSPHCPYPLGKLPPVPSLVKAATFGRVLDTNTCSIMSAVYHTEVCDRINMPVGVFQLGQYPAAGRCASPPGMPQPRVTHSARERELSANPRNRWS